MTAGRPDSATRKAVALMVCRLCTFDYCNTARHSFVVHLEVHHSGLMTGKSVVAGLGLMRKKACLEALLPKVWKKDYTTSFTLDRQILMSLMAFCTACLVDGMQVRTPGHTTQSNLDGVETALGFHLGDWLAAIDRLIKSRGACCWLLLLLSDGWRLFPETKFQITERCRRQSELSAEKYTRQRRREACQRETAYLALAGQAVIELAFHTPESVSSWSARWSDTALRQYDPPDMFWRWSERFPFLKPVERWMMANQPFWKVRVESDALAQESPESVRQLDRWMVS